MSVLVDTGVLLRLFMAEDPACRGIRLAIEHLRQKHVPLVTTFQNVAEFWNVSTRRSLLGAATA